MLYRIFTEKKKVHRTIELVSEYFSGFTCYPVTGYWKGTKEQSLCIEIVASIHQKTAINCLCEDIKQLNNQESVLMQELGGSSDYI